MTRNRIASSLGALIAAIVLTLPATAQAADGWMPRDRAVEQLESATGAARTGLGLAAGGQAVIELFVAPSGDWSLLVTQANGLSRVIGAGEAWIPQEVPVGDPI